MVESAIVMPMYVFLMLGLMQLGLMHQARLMTKYAAYKAVRAGSLRGASTTEMERAALGVLLPLVSKQASGTEVITPITSGTDFLTKWTTPSVLTNRYLDAFGVKAVEVTTCGPLRSDLPGGDEVDFDDPEVAAGQDWRGSNKTKLRVQVTFNYRMPIPFANMIIHAFAYSREVASVLRMREQGFSIDRTPAMLRMAAARGIYIVPIRSNYTMRMMSNLYPRTMPRQNQCIIPF